MSKEELFETETFLPFVQHLYAHLTPIYGESNLFCSPLSIFSGLALALCGASDQTHHAISQTIFVHTTHTKDHDAFLKKLGERLDEIKADDKLETLLIANGVFWDSNFEVNHYFLNAVRKYFHAEGRPLSFSSNSEDSRQEINYWVEGHTGFKIKDLMSSDSITSDTKLVLANAVYFKGTWQKVFHREVTQNMPFHTPTGEVSVQMMNDNGVYPLYDYADLKATCVKIPFKSCHMLVVLPHDVHGLHSLMQHLMNEHHRGHFNALFRESNYNKERIELFLPKFKLGTSNKSIDLRDPISKMGAAPMFDPHKADFQRINVKEKLYVNAMVHQATIEVNEEGAEAAAATGMAIAPMSIVPTVKIDHPFLFFIVTDSGFPVFAGHVVNPLDE